MPYTTTLLELMCGGDRQQTCSQCSKGTRVEGAIPSGGFPLFGGGLVFYNNLGPFYSCERPECLQAMIEDARKQFALLVSTTNMINSKWIKNRCDQCHLLAPKVHRCSRCWTKVYCSKECIELDWTTVHKKVCRKGEVARKVKADRKRRRQGGQEKVEEAKEFTKAMMDDAKNISEVTKAASKLVINKFK